MLAERVVPSVRELRKSAMWEVVILVLQIAGLAILVAAAIFSVAAPDWVKRRLKGPHWG
jgi:hypothetical protein